jgi:hypothetical protein
MARLIRDFILKTTRRNFPLYLPLDAALQKMLMSPNPADGI